ncbi:MAG: GTPase ObgE [Pseudobdellovibrionaceae bacterium]
MKFVDEVKVKIASGHGGPGAISFRREAMTPRGGPDGGDGGKGGDVIFKVMKNLNSLVDYRYNKMYAAQDGIPGGKANQTGAHGQDLLMMVPPGTIVRNEEGEVLIDMTDIEEYTLLKGGRGGKGNAFFKTSVNQAPEKAQPGEPGQTLEIKMELKLIADVGIVGFPNAGKSTLISRISAAKPKIADYPFTTLTPNLGVVRAGDFRTFVVADIPGLIKGAHSGAGLGIQFLRHIERTRLFVHLIDVSGMSQEGPIENYRDINYELEMYDKNNHDKEGFFPLTSRPQLVVFNKIDALREEDLKKLMNDFEKETTVKPFAVSAVTGKNIETLIRDIAKFIFVEEEK